jgi:hypothetical protein
MQPRLQPFPIESNCDHVSPVAEMAAGLALAHVLVGEPVSTSPEHALGAVCICAAASAADVIDRRRGMTFL